MAISFKSVGHFLATAFSAVVKDAAKVAGTASTVETVTGLVDPAVVPVEQAAYAVLGEVSSVITAGGAAASAKLADAGLDSAVIAKVEAVLKSFPTLVTLAKAL